MTATPVTIPNRPVFRAQEVCELAGVQSFVLRTWEAEFPDLGVAKTAGGPRVYRRADVERVLRIKHLLFVDGLTLAGVRRRMAEEGLGPAAGEVSDADMAALIDGEVRQQLRDVRRGLQWILGMLAGTGQSPAEQSLFDVSGSSRATPQRARTGSRRVARPPRTARPPKSAKAAKGAKAVKTGRAAKTSRGKTMRGKPARGKKR